MAPHPWRDATAVVTGAASGIGLALSAALVQRGANVWLTDVDAEKVRQAAEALGPQARAAALDVRDAPAVRELIERVAREAGRIDYLFNNAGVGVSGEVHELKVEAFDRIIDVNIRGVVNGIMAAYPLMVKQRSGHIVNTASMAGLTPVPLVVPYTMTKHAVVGLSTSLRLEAEVYGVRVSALCPSAIETPILDAEKAPNPDAPPWCPNTRRYLSRLAGGRPPYPVDKLAAETLEAMEKNVGVIIIPDHSRKGARLNRWLPGLVEKGIRRVLAAERSARPAGS
ncbi:MAG TPA: SDR family oxidoreductase [Thermoanaerobaculia bacterium]|nr:SDR family oxidoreductase [Thermoanaerobaculia bacterium]